ncbi:MAG: hypothetical protein ACI97A_000888 [Planctomycetota bacterium]|jgi:hypothetical protein
MVWDSIDTETTAYNSGLLWPWETKAEDQSSERIGTPRFAKFRVMSAPYQVAKPDSDFDFDFEVMIASLQRVAGFLPCGECAGGVAVARAAKYGCK